MNRSSAGVRGARAVAARSGLPWLLRRRGRSSRVTILGYHDPTPQALERHLQYLTKRYRPTTLREVSTALDESRTPDAGFVVTLDDGWAGNARLADIFHRYGVVPTVFVCTGIVGTRRRFWWEAVPDPAQQEELKRVDDAERLESLAGHGFSEEGEADEASALDRAALGALDEWADVQPHTRFHPILPRCDDERAWTEIDGSRRDLEDLLGRRPYAFAYPNGSHSAREVEMASRAGYACAVTVTPGHVEAGADPMRLPRVVIEDDASVDELALKVSGAHALARRALVRLGVLPSPDVETG